MALSDIVQISILNASAFPTQADFGIPMIMGKTPWVDLTRSYSSAAAMLADGFAATDHCYLAALKLTAQNPSVPLFKVGKRNLLPVPSIRVTPVAQNNTLYTMYFAPTPGAARVAASYTSGGAATATQIATGLVAAINALSVSGLTVTDNTGSLQLSCAAGNWFDWGIAPSMLTSGLLVVLDQTPDAGIATDLANIYAFDPTWYGVASCWNSTLETVAAAVWAEANKRQFFPSTQDTGVATATTGTVADTLKAANYKYTALWYESYQGDFLPAAVMGDRYPFPAGGENWMFAQLAGVTPTAFTVTQRSNLTGHNCNFFVTEAGLSVTFLGVASGGQYIDITRGNDWLSNDIATNIYNALANSLAGKVPYTDAGMALIEAQLRGSLRRAQDRQFLSSNPAPVISIPKVSTQAPADKSARIVRNINFTGTYAGAVDKVIINGQISF